MSFEQRSGQVVAVCMSPNHGFPTYPQERVVIGEWGIEGDAHSGPTRESFRQPGQLKQNDRPISIVADEVREEMNATQGLHMQYGDFNEQVVVRGLGDLGDVQIGSRVIFDSGVELEVTDNAMPCKVLEAHNGGKLIKPLLERRPEGNYSRRGILARVVQTGELQPGVGVTIRRPVAQSSKSS